MKRICLCVGTLLLAAGNTFADRETTVPGQQMIVARRTFQPIVLDGVLGPAEWRAAIPVQVNAVKPHTAPGVVPDILTPPDNQDDLSFVLRTMYDNDNLYVAVTVADDTLQATHVPPELWLDDDVEILIDGDRQPWDFVNEVFLWPGGVAYPNKEGYQLITSAGGGRQTEPGNNPEIQIWESAVGPMPRGFVVEVTIPLDMINTYDNSPWDADGNVVTAPTPATVRPQPGDVIGFNVFVGDNDSGLGYADPNSTGDSFLAWDGNGQPDMWGGPWIEPDWGNLYFAP
jgi:hypothetical protein